MESNQMKDKNMAAIRAVVAELAYAILPDNYRGDIWLHKLLELQRKALIALSKPARQCDVGTPEEQEKRMTEWCKGRKCQSCELFKGWQEECTLKWAQTPYLTENGDYL